MFSRYRRKEVEVRSLSGDSWLVVPRGEKVSDLRAVLPGKIAVANALLFAEGERLDNDSAVLPLPSDGERLMVHVAPSSPVKQEAPDSPETKPVLDSAEMKPVLDSPEEVLVVPPENVLVVKSKSGLFAFSSDEDRSRPRLAYLALSAVIVLVAMVGGLRQVRIFKAGATVTSSTTPSAPPASPAFTTRLLGGYATNKTYSHVPNKTAASYFFSSGASAYQSDASLPPPPAVSKKPTLGGLLTSNPTTPRSAPATPRPLLGFSLSPTTPISSTPASPPQPAVAARAPDTLDEKGAGQVEEAPSTLERLWRAATAAGTSAAEHAKNKETSSQSIGPTLKWQTQVMRAVKMLPLLALWRPAGRRLLELLLNFARRVLPEKRCKAFVHLVQARGLTPKRFDEEAAGWCVVGDGKKKY